MAGLTKIQSGGIGDDIDFDGEDTLVLDSTNNRVGIGTSSPQQNLQINDSVTPAIRFSRDTSYYWDIGHTNSDFQFNSESGGTIMHLNFNGNVGIGTTSPTEKLHVAGNAILKGTNSYIGLQNASGTSTGYIQGQSGFLVIAGGSGSSNTIAFYPQNTEAMRIDSSGRLLVGTTTAGYSGADEFTIASSGSTGMSIRSTSSTVGAIYFADGTTTTQNYQGIIQYKHSNDSLQFYTNYAGNSSVSMEIDSSGNVGIGTSSVDFSQFGSNTGGVAIEDVGSTSTGLKIGDGSNDNYLVAAVDGNFYQSHYGSGSMIFGVGSGTGTERMRLTSTGDLRFNSGYGSVATAYGVRAWAQCSSGTIRGSAGINSVSRVAAGQYRVTLSFTMPDANYACTVSGTGGNTSGGTVTADSTNFNGNGSNAVSTTVMQFRGVINGGGTTDHEMWNFIVVR